MMITVTVCVILLFLYQKGDAKVKEVIVSGILNCVLGVSVLLVGVCVQIIYNDGEVMEKIAFTIGGITVMKDYWPDSQLFKEGRRYVISKYGNEITSLIKLEKIVEESNHDVER